MSAITRGRAIAAGFLAASTLLGTALAVGPAMQNHGRPAPHHDVRLAMKDHGRPAPWHDVTLTGMPSEAKPAPHHDAIPAGMPSE